MRREELFLRDIIEAADFIAEFIAGIDREAFDQSELIRSAVVQKLALIGEACAHVPIEFRERHPKIPWPKVVAFRNILIHAYFGIDWDEVWRSATKECSVLKAQIESALRIEFGG